MCYVFNIWCIVGIYLGDIPDDVTEADVCSVFSGYGEIDKVCIKKDKKTKCRLGYGFIYFKDSRPVEYILNSNITIVCNN